MFEIASFVFTVHMQVLYKINELIEYRRFKRIYADQATIGQALGALACYEYQACESENWESSFAFALCKAIRKALCSRISGDNWEYVRPADQAERVSLMDMMRGE